MRKVFLAASAPRPCRCRCSRAGAREEVFEKAYSMEGVSRISIENVNGHIEATAWDKAVFKVRAVKSADGRPRRRDPPPDGDPRDEGR